MVVADGLCSRINSELMIKSLFFEILSGYINLYYLDISAPISGFDLIPLCSSFPKLG